MSIFDKLFELKIANKEKYTELFRNTVESVRKGTFDFSKKEVVGDGCRIVQDESSSGNCFVNIVPNEAWNLFQEMKNNVGEQTLGFSVLAGRFNGKEVRVCCFGIECNLLGKALIGEKNKNPLHPDEDKETFIYK